MRRSWILFPFLFLGAAEVFAAGAEQVLTEIRRMQAQGNHFEALQKVEAARQQNPGNPALHYYQRHLREKVYPNAAGLPLKATLGKSKKAAPAKDQQPPRLINHTLPSQRLAEAKDALEIAVDIDDPQGVVSAAALLPEISDSFCHLVPLAPLEGTLYRGRIPGWCVEKQSRLRYQIEARDRFANLARLGDKETLSIEIERPLPRGPWLLSGGGLAVLWLSFFGWRWARRRQQNKEIAYRQEAQTRAKEQKKTAEKPPSELEIIETLDPDLLPETEDRRTTKFFERRRRLFSGGKKKAEK